MIAVEMKRSTGSKFSAQVPEELARVWVRLLETPWTSLALVPTSRGASANSLMSCFDAMVAGMSGQRSRILDLRGAKLEAMSALIEEVRDARDAGDRLLLVVDDPRQSTLAQTALRVADATALLVRRGEGTSGEVQAIAGYCADGRIIGSVLLK